MAIDLDPTVGHIETKRTNTALKAAERNRAVFRLRGRETHKFEKAQIDEVV
jgi:hypothetical protein